jgi:hypothetical protein
MPLTNLTRGRHRRTARPGRRRGWRPTRGDRGADIRGTAASHPGIDTDARTVSFIANRPRSNGPTATQRRAVQTTRHIGQVEIVGDQHASRCWVHPAQPCRTDCRRSRLQLPPAAFHAIIPPDSLIPVVKLFVAVGDEAAGKRHVTSEVHVQIEHVASGRELRGDGIEIVEERHAHHATGLGVAQGEF